MNYELNIDKLKIATYSNNVDYLKEAMRSKFDLSFNDNELLKLAILYKKNVIARMLLLNYNVVKENNYEEFVKFSIWANNIYCLKLLLNKWIK